MKTNDKQPPFLPLPPSLLASLGITKSELAKMATVSRSQVTRIFGGNRSWNSESGRKLVRALELDGSMTAQQLDPYRVASRIAQHSWAQTGHLTSRYETHQNEFTVEIADVVRWAAVLDNGRTIHPMPRAVIVVLNDVISPIDAAWRVEAVERSTIPEHLLTGAVAAMLFGHAHLTLGRHEFAVDSFERATRLLNRAIQLAPAELERLWKPWQVATSRSVDEFRLWSRHMWAVALRPSKTPEVLAKAIDALVIAANEAIERSSIPRLERGNALRDIAMTIAAVNSTDPHIEHFLQLAIDDIASSGDEMMLAVTYSTRAAFRADHGERTDAIEDIESTETFMAAAHGVIRLAILNDLAQAQVKIDPVRAMSLAIQARLEAEVAGYDDQVRRSDKVLARLPNPEALGR